MSHGFAVLGTVVEYRHWCLLRTKEKFVAHSECIEYI